MKFVIEFNDDDIGEFIEELGDDMKEAIKKRLKSVLYENEQTKSNTSGAFSHCISTTELSVPYYVSRKTFNTKNEAEIVYHEMLDILDKCGSVTVSNYYEIIGYPTYWKEHEYGWTDLEDTYIKPINSYSTTGCIVGWTIELQKPVRLTK